MTKSSTSVPRKKRDGGSGTAPVEPARGGRTKSVSSRKAKPSTLASNESGPSTQPARTPNRSRIVEGILHSIFSGKFQPGDRLVSERLAQEYGVSQTPVREAIGTLTGMGVLSVKPNCGAVVRRFLPREVRDICQVRCSLECLAVRSACGRIPESELQRLAVRFEAQQAIRGTIRQSHVDDVKQTDTQLHDLIRHATRNRFLADELERIMILVRAFRDAAWNRLYDQSSPDLVFIKQEAQEHLAIVRALLDQDPDRARKAMHRHLRSGSRYIVRAVED
ncbi:MAG: GntR family transcriptional regulator [Pirellula sp.]